MKEIEIELNLNSITDTMKSLADGIKEQRTTKLIDIDGKGISITISCNKENHFLKDIDKTRFIDTGTFIMTLIGPKAKQTSIADFGDEEEETKKPKTKGELRDEINEGLYAETFELENVPKRAYRTVDGSKLKTKAFKEFLDLKDFLD
ncbi:MAG: hypothetical protein [Thorarchaeia virus VerdaV2]|uniref:Uncharacterized protein n=1 Tax=Thorarchaeia virus VerdaV2 TaxID=3070171 RepID=A0AA35CNG9_9CAUD|nr:MAG: hypothetical protein QIT42_gp21 [Thorarchaeia virus VerdaV2]BDI54915.1 MAG: hypothetical protein [Thorarchaeia virus VerdaV2]